MEKQRKRWPMRVCLAVLGLTCIWPVWADTRPAGRVTTFICNGTEQHGKLTALTLSSRANPAELDVSDNRLPLSVLYKISANWPEGADWRLQPQGDTIRVVQDNLLDLRSEMTLGGTATDWSLQGADGATVSETVYTMQSGRLKIHEAGVYRLVLSNTRVTDGRGGVGNQIVFTRTIIVSALPEKVVKSAGRITTFICNGAEQNGKVTGLTLSSHADLSVLDLSDNRVPLSALYKMSLKRPEGADWRLHPQSGASNILSDGSLDLRSELTIGKTATDWQLQYEDGTDVPDSYYVMQNGYLQIHEAGVYRLVLTNAQVKDSRGGVVGDPVVFTKAITVDWAFGLGKRDGHILSFACVGAERQSDLMSLDVRDCASLKYLHCDSNRLTSLDLSQNFALTQLYCSNNLRVVDLDEDNSLALDTLPGMDVSRIGSVTGGYIEGNRLFFNVQGVTYRYATHFPGEASLGFDTVEFTLVAAQPPVTPPDEPIYTNCDTLQWTWNLSEDRRSVKFIFWGTPNQSFIVDWGDGTTEEIVSKYASMYDSWWWGWTDEYNSVNHTYASSDTYTVAMYGKTPRSRIEKLNLDNCALTSLDVSRNANLNYLSCGYNQLTTLDVSQNAELVFLVCWINQLTELDVSRNVILAALGCAYNQLTALDVSRNANLELLYCYNNQLRELDVTQNPALAYLNCSNNQLTELDVTKNLALIDLTCGANPLTELDVTQNPALKYLACSNNPLRELDVTQNLELRRLYCYDNQLRELDVTQNLALEYLQCGDNSLTELDVTKNPQLWQLYCYNNQLMSLDVTQNLALKYLSCGYNQLTELDVTQNPALECLWCYNNQLTELDVTQNPKLRELSCQNNALQSLTLPELEKDSLDIIRIDNNQLSLSSLAEINEALQGKYVEYRIFSPQFLMDSVALDKELDLSEEMDLSDTPTEYSVWSMADSSLTEQYTETAGRFRFKEPGSYAIRLQHKDLVDNAVYVDSIGYRNYNPDSLPPVYVYHIVTVTGSEGGVDLDTIVPENGAGWIWMADAGEEKEVAFKGTGKGFRVDWGDGTTSDSKGAMGLDKQSSATKDSEKEQKHRYETEGIYTVKVEPLSSQGRLTFLDVSDERVLALSFGDVSMLEELDCSANMLVSLDLGEAEKLKDVDFSDNRLTELKLPNHQSLKEVDGEDNRLRLSALYDILSKRAAKATYGFTPQGDSVGLMPGESFDLSGEMHLGGRNTTYILRYADGPLASQTDYTESDGIFRFMETGRSYTLSMENAAVTEYENGKAMQPITFVWHITVSGVGNESNAPETAWVRAYVQERTIYLKSDFDLGQVCVYTVAGQRIYQGYSREIRVPQAGVYLVVAGGYRLKVPVLR